MENEIFLLEHQDRLKEIISPYQKELNRGQRLADFFKQCIRCVGRDDFLQLDELLASRMAANVEQEEALSGCKSLFESLREDAGEKVDRYRLKFIEDLTRLGKEADLDIVIDFPRFTVLKGIEGEVAFANRTTTINKKILKSVDPRRIVTTLARLKKQLYDRPLDPEKYIDGLYATYIKIRKTDNLASGSPVPIQRFYLDYVISLQSKVFFSNMEKGKFRGYSLEQFTVDIWRCFDAGCTSTSKGIHFKLTSGRNFSLWLLDSTGEKKQISSITFQESE
jgi:hypothetical protein